jgi:hypothetical protein
MYLEIPFAAGPKKFSLLKIEDDCLIIREKKMFKELVELIEQWLAENRKFTDKGYKEYFENRCGYLLTTPDSTLDPNSSYHIDSVENTMFYSEGNDTSAIDFFKDNSYMQISHKTNFNHTTFNSERGDVTPNLTKRTASNKHKTNLQIFDLESEVVFQGHLYLQKINFTSPIKSEDTKYQFLFNFSGTNSNSSSITSSPSPPSPLPP